MKRLLLLILSATLLFSCSQYRYETVAGDSTGTRIYTLDNGLKVYLTKNTNEPRINAVIAVKVGAKNDPLETTGLAHYFEHLMFKGSERLGTSDYAAEKPMLDSIEALFETYRGEQDPQKRKEIYAVIDSISQEASKIAIPNEYDKLMATIGSTETNAWTSEDETCYIENFPSNELENWAAIQSDRFQHPVIRGFHTELETIYEEYNMYLADDNTKANQALMEMLFPNHPYGMHDVLGKPDHLKNPSITNVKNYYSTYYVPNNYAVCLSGDLDFDSTIRTIDRWFGGIEPNRSLPKWEIPAEDPITEPKTKEVFGLESGYVFIGWRAPKASSAEETAADMASSILFNSRCGIIDEDLIQTQSLLDAGAWYQAFADEGVFMMYGAPKEGQTLEEVKDLLLAEVSKLRSGEFDENMVKCEVYNLKRREMEMMEGNSGRVRRMIDAFINGRSWNDVVKSTDRAAELTKEDIVAWASASLDDNNYAVVYKRQGDDPDIKKIEKPHITPTQSNRDMRSAFLDSLQNVQVTAIAPVFADFSRDMDISDISGVPFIYRHNEDNGLFSLNYVYETGSYADPALAIAVDRYMPLLGTESRNAMEFQKELYSLAVDFSIKVDGNRTVVRIVGLGENMEKAVKLIEDQLSGLKGDENILSELKKDIIKNRADERFNQRACFNALSAYCTYGKDAVAAMNLSNGSVKSLTSEQLLGSLGSLLGTSHRIFYYGSLSKEDAAAQIKAVHKTDGLKEGSKVEYPMLVTGEDKVVLAHYDSKQVMYNQYSCDGKGYDASIEPQRSVYNKYFGSDLVYQEMREARGLAYTARARFTRPSTKDQAYTFSAYIGTQNDKVRQAVETFEQIIEEMPEAENNFSVAKDILLTNIATTRYSRQRIFDKWIETQDLGLECNPDSMLYEGLRGITLEDLKEFQQKYIKGRTYTYSILGNRNDVDMDFLKTIGKVEIVPPEDYFGY